MLFKGTIGSQLAGSIGGITASHNKGGTYFRARRTPTNPNSAFQMIVRGAVSTLSNRWVSVLTVAQRNEWETYAGNVPRPNKVGDLVLLSGINHYVRCNTPRIQSVSPVVDNAPTVFTVGSFTTVTATASAATDLISVSFTNSDSWATATGGFLLVFCGAPQNGAVNFFKGPYRFAAKASGAVVPPTSPLIIVNPFGNMVLNQKVFLRIAASQVDGRYSQAQFLPLIVAA